MNTIYITTRSKWRKWLEEHHDSQKEIWLTFYKKHTGKPTISYDDALDEALCFGWIDGKVKRLDDECYVQRFTPRSRKSQWSTKNVARYKKLLKEGWVTEAGKKAFKAKLRVYTPVLGKNAYQWHVSHKMGKNPTIEQRIKWHLEHQKYCGCRPIPKSLLAKIPKFTHLQKLQNFPWKILSSA